MLLWGVGEERIKGLDGVPKGRGGRSWKGGHSFSHFVFWLRWVPLLEGPAVVATGSVALQPVRSSWRGLNHGPWTGRGPPALTTRKSFPVLLDSKLSNSFFWKTPKLRRKCAFSPMCLFLPYAFLCLSRKKKFISKMNENSFTQWYYYNNYS